MILNCVPIPTVSAWLGHATASFTMARYVDNQPHALTAAATMLAGLVTIRDNAASPTGDVTTRENPAVA